MSSRRPRWYLGRVSIPARATVEVRHRLGRDAAARALRMAGAPALAGSAPAAVAGPPGHPAWPAGFTGSITRSRREAWAVALPLDEGWAVGIDLEHDGLLSADEAVGLLAPGDLAHIGAARVAWDPVMLLCAKEAAYKALPGHLGRDHAREGLAAISVVCVERGPRGRVGFHAGVGESTCRGIVVRRASTVFAAAWRPIGEIG